MAIDPRGATNEELELAVREAVKGALNDEDAEHRVQSAFMHNVPAIAMVTETKIAVYLIPSFAHPLMHVTLDR